MEAEVEVDNIVDLSVCVVCQKYEEPELCGSAADFFLGEKMEGDTSGREDVEAGGSQSLKINDSNKCHCLLPSIASPRPAVNHHDQADDINASPPAVAVSIAIAVLVSVAITITVAVTIAVAVAVAIAIAFAFAVVLAVTGAVAVAVTVFVAIGHPRGHRLCSPRLSFILYRITRGITTT
jgi:hypothetical protein